MIRWTIFLCLGLFLTLQIAGEDRGQKRIGLLEAEREAQADAQKQALSAAAEVSRNGTVATEDVVANVGTPDPTQEPVVQVAFAAPDTRLVTAEPEGLNAPARTDGAEVIAVSAGGTNDQLGTVMYVAGRSVNVRDGASTRYPVVGKLTRGEQVLVVWVEDNGWARIRVEGDGIDGYMSADFLTDTAP